MYNNRHRYTFSEKYKYIIKLSSKYIQEYTCTSIIIYPSIVQIKLKTTGHLGLYFNSKLNTSMNCKGVGLSV